MAIDLDTDKSSSLMNLLMPLLDRIRRPAYGKKVKAYA